MSEIMDLIATGKKRIRVDYSPELKARILGECALPRASEAKVAMTPCIGQAAAIVVGPRRSSTRMSPSGCTSSSA